MLVNEGLCKGIAYRIEGETGPWVVLSNGIATNMCLWDGVVPYLSGSARVLRHDWPGHGKSRDEVLPETLENYATNLLALMDQLEISRAVFAGVSMGAMVSAEVALACPERAAGLVWCNAIAQATPQYSALWSELAAVARQDGMASLVAQITGRWFAQPAPAELQNLAQRMITGVAPAGFGAAAGALSRLALRERLHALECPTHCIAGAQDAAAPVEIVRAIAAQVPQAGFDCLADAAHLAPMEAPQRIAEIILDVLERARGETA